MTSQLKRVSDLAKGKFDNLITDMEMNDPSAVESAKELHKKQELNTLKNELSELTVNLKNQTAKLKDMRDRKEELLEAVKIAKSQSKIDIAREGAKVIVQLESEIESVLEYTDSLKLDIESTENIISGLLQNKEDEPCSVTDLKELKLEADAEKLLNSL